MTQVQKYQRCMVMAGGGFRLGMYLGMYAAACDVGQRPEVVVATCGAAVAAALVRSVPDDAQRLEWLSSPEMYAFWSGFGSAAPLHRTLWQAAQRWGSRALAPTVPDVFGSYLFEPPAAMPPWPAHVSSAETDQAPAVAIIGARLLFAPHEVGQPRQQRKLLEQTVFGDERTACLLHGMSTPWAQACWQHSAIAPSLATRCNVPVAQAARISVGDMYYFAPYRLGDAFYLGGVVDLFPLEIAQRLAHAVVMERKAAFDPWLAAPAWRAVLGVDAGQRLHQVQTQAEQVDVWIDSTDMARALPTQQTLRKQMQWWRNRLALRPAPSYVQYVSHMQQQWDYGYQRARQAFADAARRA